MWSQPPVYITWALHSVNTCTAQEVWAPRPGVINSLSGAVLWQPVGVGLTVELNCNLTVKCNYM